MADITNDYGVGKILRLYDHFPKLPLLNDFPYTKPAMESFLANATALRGLVTLPAYLIDMALITQKLACDSAFFASGKRTIDPDHLTGREGNRAQVHFEKLRQKLINRKRTLSRGKKGHQTKWTERIIRGFIVQLFGTPKAGFEAALAAVVVNAWTTFEALATDLWVAAVNQQPQILGTFAILNSGRQAAGDSGQKNKRPGLDLDLLREFSFDLKDQLGLALWRKKYFEFNSLDDIHTSYSSAFRAGDKDKSAPLASVNTWFAGRYFGNLMALEALRNVLVHRAGHADAQFVSRVQNHPELSKIKVGDVVKVNGDMVWWTIKAAIVRSTVLCNGVEKWLSDHTTKNPPTDTSTPAPNVPGGGNT